MQAYSLLLLKHRRMLSIFLRHSLSAGSSSTRKVNLPRFKILVVFRPLISPGYKLPSFSLFSGRQSTHYTEHQCTSFQGIGSCGLLLSLFDYDCPSGGKLKRHLRPEDEQFPSYRYGLATTISRRIQRVKSKSP